MRESVKYELLQVLREYANVDESTWETSLLQAPANLAAYEMAQLLIDVESKFDIKLEDIIGNLLLFSPRELEKEVLKSLNKHQRAEMLNKKKVKEFYNEEAI